jgi:hypothetical protein
MTVSGTTHSRGRGHLIKENDNGFLPVTYNLGTSGNRGNFYRDLSLFTDRFRPALEEYAGADVFLFMEYIRRHESETPRYYSEYLIEPLIAGVLWTGYGGAARKSSSLVTAASSFLYKIRRIHPSVKRAADALRGRAINMMIDGSPESSDGEHLTLKRLVRLIRWLSASGDFREESIRLARWIPFLKALSGDRCTELLGRWERCARLFEYEAGKILSPYTSRVNGFRENVPSLYRNRENRIFCGRSEAEYHLNMFCAEILNREYKKDFDSTREKIVLLPACMRGGNARNCKAIAAGTVIRCARCNSACGICRITSVLEKYGVATSIIPHSSDFTKFLKNWENSGTTGLVGVACVLNLLTGGYEMRRLGIPSQCVFLDFSGCAKHWGGCDTATDLSLQRLFEILEITT